MALHGTSPWVIEGLPGLAQISPVPFELAYSILPSGVSSRSLAAIGLRIFYVVDQKRIESTVVGWSRQPQVVATAPACYTINQVVAAGHEVAYVMSWPIGMPLETTGCGSPASTAWSLWLLDLQVGDSRPVAAGVTSGGTGRAGLAPVHVALSDKAYAFERSASTVLPGQSAGPATGNPAAAEVIEVHSLVDGSLLWSTPSDEPVADVMLGGSRLAVLETAPDGLGAGYRLQVADEADPALRTVASPASAAAISADGSYLAWDVDGGDGNATGVALRDLSSGQTVIVPARSSSSAPQPLDPAVSSSSLGPIVAWLATANGGSVYPAFRTPADDRGTAIASVQVTAWVSLQGSVLIWAAAAADGSLGVAYALDLAAARLGA